jgi:hypothetical protein
MTPTATFEGATTRTCCFVLIFCLNAAVSVFVFPVPGGPCSKRRKKLMINGALSLPLIVLGRYTLPARARLLSSAVESPRRRLPGTG